MAIDPSGRGSDETVAVVVKMLNGFLYLTGMRAYRGGGYADETLEDIATFAKAQQVNHVIIEANFGDGMFTKLITPFFQKYHPCVVEEVKHHKQKEARIIDTLEPVMSQHKLVVDKNVIHWDYNSTKGLPPEKALKYMLFYQMTRLTREKGALSHDDRLDCLAIAVTYWVEQMGQDADKRIEQRNEALLKQELEAWEVTGKATTLTNAVILQGTDLKVQKSTRHPSLKYTNLHGGNDNVMSFTFNSYAVKRGGGRGRHSKWRR